jgi:hypothetical protein
MAYSAFTLHRQSYTSGSCSTLMKTGPQYFWYMCRIIITGVTRGGATLHGDVIAGGVCAGRCQRNVVTRIG